MTGCRRRRVTVHCGGSMFSAWLLIDSDAECGRSFELAATLPYFEAFDVFTGIIIIKPKNHRIMIYLTGVVALTSMTSMSQ